MAKSAGKTQAGLFIASLDPTLHVVHCVQLLIQRNHIVETLCFPLSKGLFAPLIAHRF